MRSGPLIPSLLLSLALGGCAFLGVKPKPPPTPAERGHAVALRSCAACHGVERGQASPRPRAAGFDSSEMQHTAGLAGRVADLTRVGHYGMPPVALSRQDVDDLVAYIASLAERDTRGRRRAR